MRFMVRAGVSGAMDEVTQVVGHTENSMEKGSKSLQMVRRTKENTMKTESMVKESTLGQMEENTTVVGYPGSSTA